MRVEVDGAPHAAGALAACTPTQGSPASSQRGLLGARGTQVARPQHGMRAFLLRHTDLNVMKPRPLLGFLI